MIWYFIITCRKILVLLGQLEAKKASKTPLTFILYPKYTWNTIGGVL